MSNYGQEVVEKELEPKQLDTVKLSSQHYTIDKMISKIVSNENFKYRKTIRKARRSKRELIFNGQLISEVEVLKLFKKAARKSESVDEFINYFNDRNQILLIEIERSIIVNLYDNVRKTTLNGYLDEWERAWGD